MKDGALKACVGMVCVVGMYGIYMCAGPGGDGVIFGSVMAVVGGLAGFSVGTASKAAKPS